MHFLYNATNTNKPLSISKRTFTTSISIKLDETTTPPSIKFLLFGIKTSTCWKQANLIPGEPRCEFHFLKTSPGTKKVVCTVTTIAYDINQKAYFLIKLNSQLEEISRKKIEKHSKPKKIEEID